VTLLRTFRVSIAFALIAQLLLPVSANDPAAVSAVDLYKQRRYQEAAGELATFRARDDAAHRKGNFALLSARIAEREGKLASAIEEFAVVTSVDAAAKQVIDGRMSQIARSTGNALLERLLLRDAVFDGRETGSAYHAQERMAKNAVETGNFGEAAATLAGPAMTKGSSSNARRDLEAVYGEVLLKQQRTAAAREIFEKTAAGSPDPKQPDDASLRAVTNLDIIDAGTDSAAAMPSLSEKEHMRRAAVYQFNREFQSARRHYLAVLNSYPDSESVPEAIFQIGRGYTQSQDPSEALKWYERILEIHTASPFAKDALLQAASAYARVGKTRESIARYRRFIDLYPGDERLDRAYLNIVDVSRDAGDETAAMSWCDRTAEAFRGKRAEAQAVFAKARILLARQEWQRALAELEKLSGFSDLGGYSVPGGTTKNEAVFLKAATLEKLKRHGDAIDVYLMLPEGRNEFFGMLATEKLRKLAGDKASSAAAGQKLAELSAKLDAKNAEERFTAASAILRIDPASSFAVKARNVRDASAKALPRFKAIPNFTEKPPDAKDVFSTLGLYDDAILLSSANGAGIRDAEVFAKGGRADLALAVIDPIWKNLPADLPPDLIPAEQAFLLYPTPFADELLAASDANKVDPCMLLAIMRQESGFRADVKSVAAARGILQFIPSTALRIAAAAKIENFALDDLFYPPTAIKLAGSYVGELSRQFPNQPEAVIASYNGGDDNMKRWLGRSRSDDPGFYVAEIMFSQTKDYVIKVMSNYRMYRLIYDERLRPNSPAASFSR
jgi:soluble lytic murein transglycosylase